MTIRRLSGVIAAGVLTSGLLAITPGMGSAQEATVLPEKGGPITLVGCFLRVENKFVLVSPTLGPATSVTEAVCTSTDAEQRVSLDDVHRMHKVDRAKVGRWIEITGRLSDASRHEPLRKVHMKTYR